MAAKQKASVKENVYFALIDANGSIIGDKFFTSVEDLEQTVGVQGSKIGNTYHDEVVVGLIRGTIKWQKFKLVPL